VAELVLVRSMTRAILLFLGVVFPLSAQAQERSGGKDLEDSQDHWLFEFEMSGRKPVGSPDDVRAIRALCQAEALHDSHSAPIFGVVIAWTSPSQAIARVNFVDAVRGARLFVLEKKNADWLIVRHYRIRKYPPKHVGPSGPNQSIGSRR
jgi:hypothetical protein